MILNIQGKWDKNASIYTNRYTHLDIQKMQVYHFIYIHDHLQIYMYIKDEQNY